MVPVVQNADQALTVMRVIRGTDRRTWICIAVCQVLAGFSLALSGPAPDTTASPKHSAGTRYDRFADALPLHAVLRLGTIRYRLPTSVTAVAVSRDGTTVAAADGDYIRLFNAVSGKRAQILQANEQLARFTDSLALSPDGKMLASTSLTGGIHLWDVKTGKQIPCLSQREKLGTTLAFSPDGRLLAAAGWDRHVRVWEVATWKMRFRLSGHGEVVRSVCFFPDGKRIASLGHDNTIRVWDARSGRERNRFRISQCMDGLVISPDGRTLARWLSHGALILLDVASGKDIARIEMEGCGIASAAFSPDGRYLAVASAFSLRLWNARTWKEVREARKDCQGLQAIAFTPDGRWILSGGDGNCVRIWETITRRERTSDPAAHVSPVQQIALSADGRILASIGHEKTIRLWDLPSGKPIRCLYGHESPVRAIAFFPNSRILVSASDDRSVRFWNTTTGKEIRKLGGYLEDVVSHCFRSIRFSTDGKKVLFQEGSATGCLLETDTGKLCRTFETFEANDIAIAPNARMVAIAGIGGAYLWRDITRKRPEILVGTNGVATGIRFSPDGTILAATDGDDWICVWETATGRLLRKWQTADAVHHVLAISPDGKSIATGDRTGLVQLWEIATGKERARFTGHEGGIQDLLFSPDGKRLISGGADTTILVWDLQRQSVRDKKSIPYSQPKLEAYWNDLGSPDAATAYRAITALVSASSQTPPYLQGQFQAAFRSDPVRFARLILDLDNRDFPQRERAQKELERLGDHAEDGLRKALARKPSPEVRKRIRNLLDKLDGRMATRERVRLIRAVEILGHIGTPEALTVLKTVYQNAPGSWVRHEAKASLRLFLKPCSRRP